jgi:hypothetical protein
MATSTLSRFVSNVGSFGLGVYTWCFLCLWSMSSGSFFYRESEKERNELILGMFSNVCTT